MNDITIPQGYFKARYVLSGRDWIRRVSPEDRQALTRLAFEHSDYGRAGGKARAKAMRYPKGHPRAGQFISKSQALALVYGWRD